jgi:PhoH-like ATPase
MVPEEKNSKIYVLDTNVLLHDPYAFKAFDGAMVGIPAIVLEELDKFKREGTDRGRNAREFTREIDALRRQGSLKEGIHLENGSLLRILFMGSDVPTIPFGLHEADNEIILNALYLKNQGKDVRLISKDLNVRVKADALGIHAEDYLKEFVSEEEFYKGWIAVDAPSIQLKSDNPPILQEVTERYELATNEFVLVQSQHNPYNYRIFRYMGGRNFVPVDTPLFKWPMNARNPQQLMALHLLMDETVQLVTLLGPAGTGKTFLAILAGLDQVLVKERFQKIMVSRPVVPLGRDIGYLPGTLEEKLHSWMLPIYDNMEFILHSANLSESLQGFDKGQKGKGKKRNSYRKDKTGLGPIDDLVNEEKLSLEAITYMRGRSIPYQYILIDEAQNLTPHEVKTIVTRVGEGSKVILVGDPYQIDSPYLDFSSNGLVTVSEKFKGQSIFGSVFLSTSERSELSKLAGKLL